MGGKAERRGAIDKIILIFVGGIHGKRSNKG